MPAVVACPDSQTLQRFLLGQGGDAEAEAWELHLEHCERCLAAMLQLEAEDSVIEAMQAQSTVRDEVQNATVRSLAERLKGLRPAAPVELTRDQPPSSPEALNPGAETAYAFLAPPGKPGELGRLGPYDVLKVLGAGGMGVVFLAHDPHLERLVALKTMLPALAANPSARQRFLREARAAAAIKHDHIVTIYQVGEDRGAPFLAMEFLEGESLDDRLKRQRRGEVTSPLPVSELLRIGREMADGLAAAHKRGLIHRDVKPGNVWLEGDRGRVKILDFGLVRAADDAVEETRSGLSTVLPGDGATVVGPVADGPASVLTQQGSIVGTPAYMAPEQADGRPVDARSDLFSLGCVFYRMATGELPFKGKGAVSTLLAVATEAPPPPRELNPDLPPPLCDLMNRLLAKKAKNRPPSARAVVEALKAMEGAQWVLTPQRRPPLSPLLLSAGTWAGVIARGLRRRWPWAAVGLALLFVVLIAAAVVFKLQTESGEIVIETNDPNVEVVLKRGGKEVFIVDPQSKQRWRLDTEQYQLSLADQPDGLTIDLPGQQPFILRRQGQKVATVTRLPVEAAEAKVDDKTVLEGFTDVVWSVAFAPDGKSYLATGGLNQLYDRSSGREIRRFPGSPRFASFSSDGRRLLTGDDPSQNLIVWDVASGKQLQSITANFGKIRSGAFSPDGRLVIAAHGTTVRVWDLETAMQLAVFDGYVDAGHNFQMTPDGRQLLVANPDHSIRVVDMTTLKEVGRWPLHCNLISDLNLSPDGRTLLVCTGVANNGWTEPKTFVWDVAGGQQVRYLAGRVKSQRCFRFVCFLPDGRRALTADVDGTIILWNVADGQELHRWKNPEDIVSVAVAPDGRDALFGLLHRKALLLRLPDPPPEKVGQDQQEKDN